jgi:hypothetical protein
MNCPVVFPWSRCVLVKFSKGSQVLKCVPQDVSNSTWVLSHMVCPKLNSHVYKLKKVNSRGAHFVSILQPGLIRGMPNVSKNC